jgi:hypothetical protein
MPQSHPPQIGYEEGTFIGATWQFDDAIKDQALRRDQAIAVATQVAPAGEGHNALQTQRAIVCQTGSASGRNGTDLGPILG